MSEPDAQSRNFPPLAGDLLAAAAGAALPLAFAPYDLWPLAVVLPALLFVLWLDMSPGRAFRRGWLFGTGMFATGVWWVYYSMHVFGHLPPLLAGTFTGLFAVLMGLFPALAGWLGARLVRGGRAVALVLVFPLTWTLMEWVRGWFLTGFPWLDLGYSQVDAPLAGLAPYLGVYGVSWAAAVSAGLLALIGVGGQRRRGLALVALLVAWVLIAVAGRVSWTAPAGAPFQVSLVQGDTDQAVKWDPDARAGIMRRYAEATRAHWDSRLIVWPETAVPAFYRQVSEGYLGPLGAEARAHGTDLLVGLLLAGDRRGVYYNGMVSVGQTPGVYYKRHLVPFGEYIPFKAVLGGLLDILHVPMSDFTRGPAHQTSLQAGRWKVGISICYEIAFGEEVIHALPDAALLVNVSNNAWFGDSSAPHQVLEMGRMRALETQRWLLSATNDGMTAIVNAEGKVTAVAPRFKRTVLTGTVEPRLGATPYVRWGNGPVVGALLIGFVWLVLRRWRL